MTSAEYEQENATTVRWMLAIHRLYRRNHMDPVIQLQRPG